MARRAANRRGGPGRGLLAALGATVVMAVLGLGLAGVSSATPGGGLSLSDSVTSPAPGAKVTLVAELSVPGTGSFTNEIVQQIDPTKIVLTSAGDISAPAGWTVSYSTDGTSFTTVAPTTPAGWQSVRAVKATGTVDIAGGNPVARSTGAAPTGGAASISSIGTPGDGYDVILDGAGHVFNIWHHDGNGSGPAIDCHLRSGERCGAAWPFHIGYTSLYFSTGFVDEATGHLWFPTDNGPDLGFACVGIADVSNPRTCGGADQRGFVPLDQKLFWGYDMIGRSTRVGDKVFAQSTAAGSLLCLDMSAAGGSGAPCSGQPYTPAGLNPAHLPDLSLGNQGGKVYMSAGTQATCLDPVTGAICTGSWPVEIAGPSTFVYAQPDASGAVVAMCFLGHDGTTKACVSPSGGTNPTDPSLAASLKVSPWGFASVYPKNPVTVGSKVLTVQGAWGYGAASAVCHDVATDAECAGWPQISPFAYTLDLDPYDANCVWTNGDDGVIRSFTISVARPGCAPTSTQTIPLPRSTGTMNCASGGSEPIGWLSATMLAPAPADYTSATATILDSAGDPVSGWTDLPVTGPRSIDLSTLPIASTGTTPAVRVDFVGLHADASASQFRFEVAESSLALCVSYQRACPQGPGVFQDVPGSTSTVDVSASATPSAGPVLNYTASSTVIAPPPVRSQCVKRVGFDTFVNGEFFTCGEDCGWFEGETPLPGARAQILDIAGNPIIDPSTGQPLVVTATVRTTRWGTVADGAVDLLPGLYRVRFTDEDGYALDDVADYNCYDPATDVYSNCFPRQLAGTGEYTGALKVTSPAEDPYSYWYSVNWVDAPPKPPTVTEEIIDPTEPTVFPIITGPDPVDPSPGGTIEPEGVRLCDNGETPPDCTATEVTIPGEGTWTVDPETGDISFEPEEEFEGESTVTYQVTDSNDETGSGELTARTPTPDVGSLPYTGSRSLPLVLGAMTLILGGAGLELLRRRRRPLMG